MILPINRRKALLMVSLMTAIGLGLSALLKYGLNAPNFGQGVFISTVLVGFLYGIRSALVSYVVGMGALIPLMLGVSNTFSLPLSPEGTRVVVHVITMVITLFVIGLLRFRISYVHKQAQRSQERDQTLQSLTAALNRADEQLGDAINR